MNSLEFINKEIELTKDVIENTQEALSNDANSEIRMYCYFNKEAVLDKLNYAKERLQTLQQIKSELEAWEVVKHLIYKRKMGEERFIQVMGGVYNEGQCWTSGINPYETIKKALEVEDEKEN